VALPDWVGLAWTFSGAGIPWFMALMKAQVSVPTSPCNALVRRFYEEFPQVPAGFVADVVQQAWGDMVSSADGQDTAANACAIEVAEREARRRLLEWQRRVQQAIVGVGVRS
jgi:hypothetical protein